MADVTAMLTAYHESDVPGAPAREYAHIVHVCLMLHREIARAMGIQFVEVVERGKGIRGDDRYRVTLTCSRAQHIWFREIYFQRASIN